MHIFPLYFPLGFSLIVKLSLKLTSIFFKDQESFFFFKVCNLSLSTQRQIALPLNRILKQLRDLIGAKAERCQDPALWKVLGQRAFSDDPQLIALCVTVSIHSTLVFYPGQSLGSSLVPLVYFFSHSNGGKGHTVWMTVIYYHSIKGMGTTKENPKSSRI